jgi:hypothetical protein
MTFGIWSTDIPRMQGPMLISLPLLVDRYGRKFCHILALTIATPECTSLRGLKGVTQVQVTQCTMSHILPKRMILCEFTGLVRTGPECRADLCKSHGKGHCLSRH